MPVKAQHAQTVLPITNPQRLKQAQEELNSNTCGLPQCCKSNNMKFITGLHQLHFEGKRGLRWQGC